VDKFYIIGLPRSRTYWLSQFLGCLHEGIYYYPKYSDFLKSDHSGDSTTVLPLIRNQIRNEKKVIIHRDVKDVDKSLIKLFGITKDFSSWRLHEEDGLHIEFNEINDRLEEIWDYCKSSPFPVMRAEIMKNQTLNNDNLIEEVKLCL